MVIFPSSYCTPMPRDGNGYIGSGLSLPNFHLKKIKLSNPPAANLNNYQFIRNSVDFLWILTFKIIDIKKIV